MSKRIAPTNYAFLNSSSTEEACFVEWTKSGSLMAAQRSLTAIGYLTTGGKPLDASFIYKQAYHWVAFHPNAARKHLNDLVGLKFAEDDWLNYWVIKSLLGLTVEAEVLAWIREYGVVFDVKNKAAFPPDKDTER
jgi:hypothetical protein